MSLSFWLYITSVVIASVSQLLLKKSASQEHGSFLKEYLNPYVIAGYGMLFLSMFLTVLAFRGLDYKNGPVIESLGYVLVLFLSRVFFKEKLTYKKLVGTGCILVGIVIFYL